MMTVRPFLRKGLTVLFDDRRGSAAVWLIAALCFVVVFAGVAFFLLKDSSPDRVAPPIQTVSKREVREPIQPYVPSDKAISSTGNADATPDTLPPKETEEKPVEPEEPSPKADPSAIQEVLPDDTPGKGILSKDLDKNDAKVLEEPETASGIPSTPPSEAKPKVVEETTDLSEDKLPAEEEKATTVQPPEDPVTHEKKEAEAAEIQKDVKPLSDEKGLEELTVAVLQGNVRGGPSAKDAVLFRIAHGDKVRKIDRKGNWYAVHLEDGRSGWAHRSLFKASSTASLKVPSKASSEKASESTRSRKKGGVIKGIRTKVTDPNRAQIVFELDGYFPPEIMVIEGEAPRVVCDFFSASLAPDVKKAFTVTTDVVKRIRVGVHKEPNPKIRVVLDLNPGRNYAVEQFFFEKENYYALMINTAK